MHVSGADEPLENEMNEKEKGLIMKKFAMMLALAAIFALNTATPTQAGAVGGSRYGVYTIPPFGTHTFYISFRAGEYAAIEIDGDGDTDLDLYVYDDNGWLIDSDADDLDYCLAGWRPRYTAPFTIKIVNRGRYYNRYTLATN